MLSTGTRTVLQHRASAQQRAKLLELTSKPISEGTVVNGDIIQFAQDFPKTRELLTRWASKSKPPFKELGLLMWLLTAPEARDAMLTNKSIFQGFSLNPSEHAVQHYQRCTEQLPPGDGNPAAQTRTPFADVSCIIMKPACYVLAGWQAWQSHILQTLLMDPSIAVDPAHFALMLVSLGAAAAFEVAHPTGGERIARKFLFSMST